MHIKCVYITTLHTHTGHIYIYIYLSGNVHIYVNRYIFVFYSVTVVFGVPYKSIFTLHYFSARIYTYN